MADRKSLAIGLGVVVGAGAVAIAVACYARKNRAHQPRDVNEIFESARQTIREINESLDKLRSATEESS